MDPNAEAGWTADTHLLATLIETTVNINRKKHTREFTIKRPERKPEPSTEVEVESFAAEFGGRILRRKK